MDSAAILPHKRIVQKPAVKKQHSAPAGAGEEHARLRLLRNARDLLSAFGTKGATARAICARAGVQAPTLYYYFGDLTRLHAAAVNASFVEVMAGYRLQSRSSGTIDGIRLAWDTLVRFGRTDPLMARLLIQYVLDGNPPTALRLTLARLGRDLRGMEEDGKLTVSAEDAVTVLWTAAVGATSMAASHDGLDIGKGGPSDILLNVVLAGITNLKF